MHCLHKVSGRVHDLDCEISCQPLWHHPLLYHVYTHTLPEVFHTHTLYPRCFWCTHTHYPRCFWGKNLTRGVLGFTRDVSGVRILPEVFLGLPEVF